MKNEPVLAFDWIRAFERQDVYHVGVSQSYSIPSRSGFGDVGGDGGGLEGIWARWGERSPDGKPLYHIGSLESHNTDRPYEHRASALLRLFHALYVGDRSSVSRSAGSARRLTKDALVQNKNLSQVFSKSAAVRRPAEPADLLTVLQSDGKPQRPRATLWVDNPMLADDNHVGPVFAFPIQFLLDSGADMSYITAQVAELLHAIPTGKSCATSLADGRTVDHPQVVLRLWQTADSTSHTPRALRTGDRSRLFASCVLSDSSESILGVHILEELGYFNRNPNSTGRPLDVTRWVEWGVNPT